MNTVIVPLDGSDLSARALGLGEVFAQAMGARLALVHVLEEPIVFDLVPSLLIPDRMAAEAYLRRVATEVTSGAEVSTYVVRGNPVDALIALTRDEPESMLVMTTHGRSGLGRLMLGSVADKVVRESAVPVALVRGSGAPRRRSLHSLLVPLDGSMFSEEALPFAVDLARRCDASLGLVNICDPFWVSPHLTVVPEQADGREGRLADVDRQALASGRSYLERVAEGIRSQGISVRWEVRFGKPADEIVRAAETTEADLIVMTTHGRGGVRRLAFGSVANEVLHRGTIPILMLPPRVSERGRHEAEQILSSV
ncbi:MAG: universal stress protein [Thermomicrobiales bacterium]